MQAQHLKARRPWHGGMAGRAVQLFPSYSTGFLSLSLLPRRPTRVSNRVCAAPIKADDPRCSLHNPTHSPHLHSSKASFPRPLLYLIASGRHTSNPIMSYQQQGASATAYPPPGQQQQQAYVAPPPPAGYPQRDQQYPDAGAADTTTSRGGHGHHHGGGFWRGCCAALCCCCLLDACF